VSPLTTHILDTSLGVPAEGVTIQMEQRVATGNGDEGWIPVATGATNSDGRVTDLLPGFYDSCRLFQKGTEEVCVCGANIIRC
jgi:5-hydroxyisourate hydrolase